MTEKLHTTQQDELTQLLHEVGLSPAEVQQLMREALRQVPQHWNADTAVQPQGVAWRIPIRQHICELALRYFSSDNVPKTVDQLLTSSVRQNLINLGNKQLDETSAVVGERLS